MYKYSCIITAGGTGTRFDSTQKKQFICLYDKPILHYAIELFYDVGSITEIVVSLPSDGFPEMDSALRSAYPQRLRCVMGGETRQESVYNALQTCDESNDFVIIHDGVRPFLDRNDLEQMMSDVTKFGAIIPASKVRHTIKSVSFADVDSTLSRDSLVEVYTPQIFSRELITKGHHIAKNDNLSFTDDASICEYINVPVKWYETMSPRLKITTKDDLIYAEYLLKKSN